MNEEEKSKKEESKKVDRLDMKLDEFGGLNISIPIDELNEFLDDNLDDKKLTPRQKKKKS